MSREYLALGCFAEELPVSAPEHSIGKAHKREEGNGLEERVNSFCKCW
jgi:hypothetical protein